MSQAFSWEDQRAFLAVLEEGSLSAAARRLNLTQPTVRTRIESLERALGTALFIRSVHGLTPTDQARALEGPARAMASASEAFVRAASAPPGEVAGIVRVSVAEFVGIEVLPPMLAALRERHPRLVIELSLSDTSADLLDQEADIAVRMHPPTQGALVARKSASIPLGLFAHRDYLARLGVPARLEDLRRHDIIAPDRRQAELQFAASLLGGRVRERASVCTDSHPAQLALARAGLGIAVVQIPVGRADPRLERVLPALTVATLDAWLVMHGDLRHVPRVRTVFDHLGEAFAAYAAA